MVIKGEVPQAHGRQRRRRFSASEKIALVEECNKMGLSVSAVARKCDISPSQLLSRRKLMKDGEMKAVETEEVVPVSEVKALKAKIRELERSLGKKAHENEILKDLLEFAKEKKTVLAIAAVRTKGHEVITDSKLLGIARSNVMERLR
jgi:transposase